MKKETDRRAFTLIELLVVIAIIVLLVAFLVPNLSGVLQWARTHQCARNLRHISEAIADHWADGHGTFSSGGWPAIVLPNVDNQAEILICPESVHLAGGEEGDIQEAYTALSEMGQMEFSNSAISPLAEEVFVAKLSQTQHDAARAAGLLSGAESANGWVPWAYVPDENPHIYWLCYEDLRGGDRDFKDIMLKITETGGTSTISFWRGGTTGLSGNMVSFELGVVRSFGSWGNNNDLVLDTSIESYPFLTGGATTYGMNTNAARVMGVTGKILAVDFDMVVVDTDAGAWAANPIFARHGEKMNAVYMDGSVRLKQPDDIDPAADTVADRYWRR